MKKLTATLILLLVASSLAPSAAGDTGTGPGPYMVTLSAAFNLIAVVEGREEGVLIPATLTASYPGNGSVRVMVGGSVGATTLASTLQAVKLASLLSGIDWRQWDFTLTIHSDSGVDGPSGSVMVALVAYTLLSGSPRSQGYEGFTVTGAISPDGLASSVGGVQYKCMASESRGLTFYYPLVNYTAGLARSCTGSTYTGLLNLTSQVYGVPEPGESRPPYTLPPEFNETMREAALKMAGEAQGLLEEAQRLGATGVDQIAENLRRSREMLEAHPYAAASLAFTALSKAYTAYLQGVTRSQSYEEARLYLDGVAGNVSARLGELEGQLESLPANGSIYYVEFLATAYTRLAAAESSLLAYRNYSDSADTLRSMGIQELAHAAARVSSIEEWIKSANATRNEKPFIGSPDIERLAWVLGDYARTSGEYASSIAQYAVSYYGRDKALLVYMGVLDSLRRSAESYMNQSNYLAAIGFYRELLSQSLNVMFQASIQAYKGPIPVTPYYFEELERMYSILVSRLLSKGLTPGLAPAYYDYALAMRGLNETDTGLLLLDEAVVSALTWDMMTIAVAGQGQSTLHVEIYPQQGYSEVEAYFLAGVAGLFAYVVGYLSSVRSASRIISGRG